jgi:hypothetical protein
MASFSSFSVLSAPCRSAKINKRISETETRTAKKQIYSRSKNQGGMLIHSLQYSPETGPESRINGTELSATAEQVAERNGNARKNLAYCYGHILTQHKHMLVPNLLPKQGSQKTYDGAAIKMIFS